MEILDSCPICGERHAQAYNGVLQLRNPDNEVIRCIEEELVRAHEKGNYCVKIIELKEGIDYQFSSAPFTKHLGKFLQQRFGGELKETSRLVTRSKETSKELHRLTVLFRLPDFKKGDIAECRGRDVKIINCDRKVFVQDIKTNKKLRVDYSEIRIV